jgi:hypothetical protein
MICQQFSVGFFLNGKILGLREERLTLTYNMKGTYIGEFEELVLLSVGILLDDAYRLPRVDELEKQTGRSIMISSVHKALVRLEDKGYLKSKTSTFAPRSSGLRRTKGGDINEFKEIYL